MAIHYQGRHLRVADGMDDQGNDLIVATLVVLQPDDQRGLYSAVGVSRTDRAYLAAVLHSSRRTLIKHAHRLGWKAFRWYRQSQFSRELAHG